MRVTKRKLKVMTEGDMTPMIDMTFQLIAFFMVLLNFSDVEVDQRIKLPASELAKPPESAYKDPMSVQITDQPAVMFASEEYSVEGLRPALRTEAAIIKSYTDKSPADVTVIVRADAEVKTGVVQEVIAMCQEAGFEKFVLRGRQSDAPTFAWPVAP